MECLCYSRLPLYRSTLRLAMVHEVDEVDGRTRRLSTTGRLGIRRFPLYRSTLKDSCGT